MSRGPKQQQQCGEISSTSHSYSGRSGLGDVRLRGFDTRVPTEEALGWIDAHSDRLGSEEVPTEDAAGRILTAPITCPLDLPAYDCAAADGYAVRSEETIGAGNYNPVSLSKQPGNGTLGPLSATVIRTGMPLPSSANAVLPFGGADDLGATLELSLQVAPGAGVHRKGQEFRIGSIVLDRQQPLLPQDLGLAASLGLTRLTVVRRPRIALVIAGPKNCSNHDRAMDSNGPMLRALIARDGGSVDTIEKLDLTIAALASTLAGISADAILIAGRTGTGPDDISPLALAEAGRLDVHGVAISPGGSAGMGCIGEIPVILLPGDPLAAFCAYDFFAGRLIRTLAGHDPRLPYRVRNLRMTRKITSEVGQVDICRVKIVGDMAEPLGAADFGGLASAVRADGFVIVPAAVEGYPPGASVSVHCYDCAATDRLAPTNSEAC